MTNIYKSFVYDLLHIIQIIEDNPILRYSKKRKIDKISYVIDDHAIIYESDDDIIPENKRSLS